MKKVNLIKIAAVIIGLAIIFFVFSFTPKSETQTLNSSKTPEKVVENVDEVAGYKNWTKVNDKPQLMKLRTAELCRPATVQEDVNTKGPHEDKFINVFVNSIGKDEMLSKKNPKFPVGTVIVKEKLSFSDRQNPELLTVMIKRQKDFNPEVGDWEFMTFNGEATKVTSRGKLESCQACHIGYKQNDYISRDYLSDEKWKKLK